MESSNNNVILYNFSFTYSEFYYNIIAVTLIEALDSYFLKFLLTHFEIYTLKFIYIYI